MYNFKRILKEGGHRRHISQELRDKFIHNVLIIPNPEDRQSEIDSIFAEIAEKNQEEYFKQHPELKKEQIEESKKNKLKEDEEDRSILKLARQFADDFNLYGEDASFENKILYIDGAEKTYGDSWDSWHEYRIENNVEKNTFNLFERHRSTTRERGQESWSKWTQLSRRYIEGSADDDIDVFAYKMARKSREGDFEIRIHMEHL
jgi:hypothetical protein